jgi:hypothetical protein
MQNKNQSKQPRWLFYLEIIGLTIGIIAGAVQIYSFVETKAIATQQKPPGGW